MVNESCIQCSNWFSRTGPAVQARVHLPKEAWCYPITQLRLKRCVQHWITVVGINHGRPRWLNHNLHCKGECSKFTSIWVCWVLVLCNYRVCFYKTDFPTLGIRVTWTPSSSRYLACLHSQTICWSRGFYGRECPSMPSWGTANIDRMRCLLLSLHDTHDEVLY